MLFWYCLSLIGTTVPFFPNGNFDWASLYTGSGELGYKAHSLGTTLSFGALWVFKQGETLRLLRFLKLDWMYFEKRWPSVYGSRRTVVNARSLVFLEDCRVLWCRAVLSFTGGRWPLGAKLGVYILVTASWHVSIFCSTKRWEVRSPSPMLLPPELSRFLACLAHHDGLLTFKAWVEKKSFLSSLF